MIHTIAIAGYRSIRDLVLPLSQLTVVTGENGTGKTSVYRALRLMADMADDRVIASLAKEGGFNSVRWAGPEKISRAMRAGELPIQGTTRSQPITLKLGIADESISYAIELGLPVRDALSLFNDDAEIKAETLWYGLRPTPSKIMAKRRGPHLEVRTGNGLTALDLDIAAYESLLRNAIGQDIPWELNDMQRILRGWRFYDHIRTDPAAPARQVQPGTRTLALSPDGSDLAAAVQTIFEIGNAAAFHTAIETAFPGSRISVEGNGGVFRLLMKQPGMLRPLDMTELSDGTLRFVLLVTALLSPRPAPLLILNEPESSLHRDVMPALAKLIASVSEVSQVLVVSHDPQLVTDMLQAGGDLVELYKDFGETRTRHEDVPGWVWPKR